MFVFFFYRLLVVFKLHTVSQLSPNCLWSLSSGGFPSSVRSFQRSFIWSFVEPLFCCNRCRGFQWSSKGTFIFFRSLPSKSEQFSTSIDHFFILTVSICLHRTSCNKRMNSEYLVQINIILLNSFILTFSFRHQFVISNWLECIRTFFTSQ